MPHHVEVGGDTVTRPGRRAVEAKEVGHATRAELRASLRARHGLPKDDPAFWRGLSPRPDCEQITDPVVKDSGSGISHTPILVTTPKLDCMNISVEVGPSPRLYSGQVGLLSIAPDPVRSRAILDRIPAGRDVYMRGPEPIR